MGSTNPWAKNVIRWIRDFIGSYKLRAQCSHQCILDPVLLMSCVFCIILLYKCYDRNMVCGAPWTMSLTVGFRAAVFLFSLRWSPLCMAERKGRLSKRWRVCLSSQAGLGIEWETEPWLLDFLLPLTSGVVVANHKTSFVKEQWKAGHRACDSWGNHSWLKIWSYSSTVSKAVRRCHRDGFPSYLKLFNSYM